MPFKTPQLKLEADKIEELSKLLCEKQAKWYKIGRNQFGFNEEREKEH